MSNYLRSISLLVFLLSLNTVNSIGLAKDPKALSFLLSDFAESVEFSFQENQDVLTGHEAFYKLDQLIKSFNPENMTEKHAGQSKDGQSSYGIIHLSCRNGDYRIFYYSEKSNGKYLVKKIRIHRH